MALRIPLGFFEFNDETLHVVILDKNMNPTDCTGRSVEFVYKTDSSMSEVSAIRIAGVFTDPLIGACDFSIPNANVVLTNRFYRIDVLQNGLRKTAAYGPVNMVDL